MPRGHKSKLRAREKRCQVRDEPDSLQGAQATAVEEKGSPTPPSPVSGGPPSSSPALSPTKGTTKELQEEQPTTSAAACASCKEDDEGAKSQNESQASTFKALTTNVKNDANVIVRRAGMLVDLMLYKYKMQQPITKADMLKIVSKRFRDQFSEIFKMATDRLELIFGIFLKKIKPTGHSYTFVHDKDLADDGSPHGDSGGPNKGLLMPLLGLIYSNGNHTSEEDIWYFLSNLGVYEGEKHFVYGDPREIIRQFIEEKYMEYRQIPGSDPPRYEYLWGPTAQCETFKAKVLEFIKKVNDITPDALPYRRVREYSDKP
ncbi:melanoma-associated antigen B1-like [Suncus etruscus]|uniref:melanoma-associated antigen B1-like n=1 Tax=Suncus etruscus TaxID=109475 RepID=UPI00210FBEC0|nr:melanoma-associated antigen B1-like [Suncus etruscus]